MNKREVEYKLNSILYVRMKVGFCICMCCLKYDISFMCTRPHICMIEFHDGEMQSHDSCAVYSQFKTRDSVASLLTSINLYTACWCNLDRKSRVLSTYIYIQIYNKTRPLAALEFSFALEHTNHFDPHTVHVIQFYPRDSSLWARM